jgi:hypothetical protein
MKRYILLFVIFGTQINFAQSIFPTDGGNVGIGTITPTSKLEVKGTIKSLESTPLPDPISSSQLINEVGGITGIANKLYSRLWLYRDNGSSSNWWTARLHDGIAIDVSFNTPQVDTKTWWERDPYDNIQSWGNAAETYLSINKGNVGIGTISPKQKLTIVGNQNGLDQGAPINGQNSTAILRLQSSPGGAGEVLDFGMNIKSYGWIQPQDFNDPNAFYNLILNAKGGNVGIGTTTPDSKLAVNGTIHSKEVKVDMLGWPDYVFKKEYNLPTLEEVEKHINEKGHLENIPSEEEVLKNGINLGEMNAKLLQKIEELTLYMIEMKKENIEVKKQNVLIKEENDLMKKNQIELEKRILKIENN